MLLEKVVQLNFAPHSFQRPATGIMFLCIMFTNVLIAKCKYQFVLTHKYTFRPSSIQSSYFSRIQFDRICCTIKRVSNKSCLELVMNLAVKS